MNDTMHIPLKCIHSGFANGLNVTSAMVYKSLLGGKMKNTRLYRQDRQNIITHIGIWPGSESIYIYSCRKCHGTANDHKWSMSWFYILSEKENCHQQHSTS